MALSKELNKILGKDLAKQVDELIGDNVVSVEKENMIPQTDFDKRIKSIQKARDGFEAELGKVNLKLEALKGSTDDVDALKIKIGEINDAHKIVVADMKKENAQIKLDGKINDALSVAKVRSTNAAKAVKALINMEKVSLDGENLIGLTDQLAALLKSDPYLFNAKQSAGGNTPGNLDNNNTPPGDKNYQKELDEARKNRNTRKATALILEAHEAGVSIF